MNKFICHVGVGFFHRSHQAYCLNRLKTIYPVDTYWTFKGVGLLDSDYSLFETLKKQQFQYHTIERINNENNTTLMNSISDLFCLPKQPSLIKQLNTSELKAVTTTITEKGYCLNENGKLSMNHPLVVQDIKNNCYVSQSPKTIYGVLYYILMNRYNNKLSGLPVISCDNMLDNSTILKKGLLDFIEKYQQYQEINESYTSDFLYWLDYNMTFPNTMVDRITTNINHNVEVNGVNFGGAVLCEPYLKWVIEDNFTNKKNEKLEFPDFHRLKEVTITKNITMHENIKLLLLNGSHSLIAYMPSVNTFVSEVIACSKLRTQLKKYMNSILSLRFSQEDIDKYDINTYTSEIVTRFSNNHIQDTIQRLRVDGGKKIQAIFTPLFQHMYETHVLTDIENIKYSLLPIHYYFIHLDISQSVNDDDIGCQIKSMATKDKFKYIFGDELGIWLSSQYDTIYNKPNIKRN